MNARLADTFVSVVALPGRDLAASRARLETLHATLSTRYENFEIVLVVQASEAPSPRRVSELIDGLDCVRCIVLSRPVGTETALLAGLDSAIGDLVVTLELDLDPAAQVPELVERCRAGVDVLYGVVPHGDATPLGYRMLSAAFRLVAPRLMAKPMGPTPTRFRCFSRQAVNALTRVRRRQRNFSVLLDEIGFRSEPFDYQTEGAIRAEEYYGLANATRRALEILFADSVKPLRLAGFIGILGSGLSLLYAVYVVVVNFVKQEVMEGWTTLSLQASGMFLLLFIILTVLVEYVGRLLDEIGTRPLYHVRDEQQSSSMLAHEERRNVYESSTEDERGG